MNSTVQTKNAPQAIGPYSQGIQWEELLFISGQLGLDTNGILTASDISSQTHQVLSNIQSILEAAGLKMDNVLKTTIFLADLKDFNAVNQIYSEYFKVPYPARSCIQVSKLPKNALIEIEVIAGH